MKLKKCKQILKLYLLNLRTYENIYVKSINSGFLTDLNLIRIISNLKKALYTISEYHQLHKKILFVGLPKKLAFRINKFTYHTAVDSNQELQNIFLKVLNKPLVLKLSKKPDLVVILRYGKTQDIIIKNNAAKIPVINFILLREINVNYNYDIIKNFSQNLVLTSNKTLFFLGLNFLFKRIKKK